MTLRIGVIGANWALRAHGAAWALVPGAEVVAVCTSRRDTADAAAAAYGLKGAYDDYRLMMADPTIDIVDIATKPSVRPDMVFAALEAGKHVNNAIPFAMSAPQALAMRDLQLGRGLVGVVDAQFRWVPAYSRMKEMIDDGFLGEAVHATMTLQLPLTYDKGDLYPAIVCSAGENSHLWLGEAGSGASAWRNFGSHSLLMLTHLLGPIEEIVASTDIHLQTWQLPAGGTFQPANDDVGVALVRFVSGAVATVTATWITPDPDCVFLEVSGTRGRLAIRDRTFGRDPHVPLRAVDARPRNGSSGEWSEPLPERLYTVAGGGYGKDDAPHTLTPLARMFEHMARAIDDGTEGSPSFSEASHVHCAVEAGAHSMLSRSWTRVDQFERASGP